MNAWYIDAIDARAGIAVASLRKDDLVSGNPLAVTAPLMWIAPPTFTPQPLVSPNVGFAFAHMHHAQSGLFNQDGFEIGFDSLAGLAEFVRRAYVRGAAGDGPDETGGPAPPLPAPEGGDGGPEGLRERGEPFVRFESSGKVEAGLDPVSDISGLQKTWSERRNAAAMDAPAFTGEGRAYKQTVQALDTGGLPGESCLRRLARGALHVLRELRLRRPQPRDVAAMVPWREALQRHAVVVTRMGLWAAMRNELSRPNESWEFGAGDGASWLPWLEDRIDALLLGEGDPFSRRPWDLLYAMQCCGADDAFDDLARFPVPREWTPDGRRDASLQTLLSATLASPLQIPQGHLAEVVEVALFAASCLSLANDGVTPAWGWDDEHSSLLSHRIALHAHAWLIENLPAYLYDEMLEDLLSKASAMPA